MRQHRLWPHCRSIRAENYEVKISASPATRAFKCWRCRLSSKTLSTLADLCSNVPSKPIEDVQHKDFIWTRKSNSRNAKVSIWPPYYGASGILPLDFLDALSQHKISLIIHRRHQVHPFSTKNYKHCNFGISDQHLKLQRVKGLKDLNFKPFSLSIVFLQHAYKITNLNLL